MGRKPDPFIALHFVRGRKSGKNTNRYEQTCRHCHTQFPTGRQETLRAHLGRCLALTQAERAEAISQIYQTPSPATEVSPNTTVDQQHILVSSMAPTSEMNDGLSGLDLLAGAAQNATDMMIDPNLTVPESHSLPTTTAEEMQYFGNHDMAAYHHDIAEPAWDYSMMPGQDPRVTFDPSQDQAIATTEAAAFAEIPITEMPSLSYAEVATVPPSFVTHPTSEIPFLDTENISPRFVHESGQVGVAPSQQVPVPKTRKVKEPYSPSKKIQVSNMRRVGACIRCSRLRKNCDPNRPCAQCQSTKTSKTWIGECTSLQRGRQFTLWYEGLAQNKSANHLETFCANSSSKKYNGYLELAFFGEDGPKMQLDILSIHGTNRTAVMGPDRFVVDEGVNIAQRLLEHSRQNLELIIESVTIPSVHATVRVASGLASLSSKVYPEPVWGSGIHGDENFARVFDIWLATALLEMEAFDLALTVVDNIGTRIAESPANPSFSMVRHQIDASLESVINKSEKDGVLHKFDANILSQSYKHLFNLVIGIVLILNAIEKYCNFVERKPLLESDEDVGDMLEAALEVVEPYRYCVQNIKMMPKLITNIEGCLVADEKDDRVDWSLQRAWISDMCLTVADLEGCESGNGLWGGDASWEGRLLAPLFLAMREA